MSRSLLRHQAMVDSLVCIMGILMYSQDPMWMTGNDSFDHLLCQVWHGQAIFWTCVLVSVWNLVLIATERWLMICSPYKHRNMRLREMYKWLIAMYSICFFFLVPAFFQIRYHPLTDYTNCNVTTTTGHCIAGEFYFDNPHFERFMGFYGIFWLIICYAIPVGLFIFLYSKIVICLREKRNDAVRRSVYTHEKGSGDKVLKKADQQITKTAIIVTVGFFLCLSWDSWYCFLGFPKIIKYEFNSKLQVMGVFLAAFNSCTNPFIYAASMSIFRRSLKKTFHCLSGDQTRDSETNTSYMKSNARTTLGKTRMTDNNESKMVNVNTSLHLSDFNSEVNT